MTTKSGSKKRVESERARKLTYKKRMTSIKKKATELSVLCDITVCAICIGPDGEVGTWPEGHTDVKFAIDMYHEKVKSGRVKKKIKAETVEERTEGIGKQSLRLVMPELSNGSLAGLMARLDSKLDAVAYRLEFLKALGGQKEIKGKEIAPFRAETGQSRHLFDGMLGLNGDVHNHGHGSHDLYQPLLTVGPDMGLLQGQMIYSFPPMSQAFVGPAHEPLFNNPMMAIAPPHYGSAIWPSQDIGSGARGGASGSLDLPLQSSHYDSHCNQFLQPPPFLDNDLTLASMLTEPLQSITPDQLCDAPPLGFSPVLNFNPSHDGM